MLHNILKIMSGTAIILKQASTKFRENTKDFIEQKIFSEKFVSQRDFNNLKSQFLNLKEELDKLKKNNSNK